MDRCLRCNQPCSAASVFCDQCRLLLRSQLRQDEDVSTDISKEDTSPLTAVSAVLDEKEKSPEQKQAVSSPQTPPVQNISIPANQEQAVFLLSDAARRIAEFEPGDHRLLRASRLAPLRDISSQIHRHSTPLSRPLGGSSTEPMPEVGAENALPSSSLPDLWPWLHEAEEPQERDHWVDEPDPLIDRRMPTIADVAPLEKADIRRARKEGFPTAPLPRLPLRKSHMRIAFFCLAILAILALTIDSVLISFTFIHTQQTVHTPPPGAPTLTLSPNVANYGSHVTLHLSHFAHSAMVVLTHDVAVPLRTTRGGERFAVNSSGSMDIETVIDGSWEPGFHTIVAEDTQTRYTANASLQVAAGPTRPARLVLNTTEINFGAEVIGGTTIQRFVLTNGGGGSITWSANSDVSWLSITPNQGTFSDAQTITIGCTRSNMMPGDYNGVITFSNSVGNPQKVPVSMTVRPLPSGVGPVLAVSPAGLSFTAVDGGADPAVQSLVISNPGSQALNWNLSANTALISSTQNNFLSSAPQSAGGSVQPYQSISSPLFASVDLSNSSMPDVFSGLSDTSTNWVTTAQSTGMVRPHDTQTLNIMIHSGNLLPGTYINTLVFSADNGALNAPQSVSISLTVLPQCGLTLSTGSLSFTAIAGSSNPTGQSFNLMPTTSCASSLPWTAASSASWLTVTPTSGRMNANNSVTPPLVNVNISNLKPAVYSAAISIMAGQSTQTIVVTLTVQAPPPPTAPIMGVSTLSLNLTTTQGATNPSGQQVTIANTGQSALQWRTTINLLATSWLGVYPSGGTITPGQTGALTVNAITKNLTPGKYVGQIVLSGSDAAGNTAGGSPQTVAVTLTVLPPCKITQPSSSALAFSAVQGGADPSSQSIVLAASGNCLWPLSWHTTTSAPASWLKMRPNSGSFTTSGQPSTLVVAPTVNGLTTGSYSSQVSLVVTDSSGVQVSTPQTFSVALSVAQPCSISTDSNALAFALIAGGTSSKQVSLKDAGSCAWPVSWTATIDSGSSSWLAVSNSSGSDTGSGGSFGATITTGTLSPGTYKGTITVTATGSGQANVLNSPLSIPVTLTVSSQPTVSVSGIVNACADSACSSSSPLAGATVKLQDSSGNTVGMTTTTSTGNYTISGVPTGSYKVLVSGADINNNHYSVSVQLTVSATVTGFSINAIPG